MKWAAAISLGFFSLLYPQEKPPSYSVEVDVVQILATVKDDKDHLVADLTKDAFILEEEGRQQEIEYFVQQTDLPLTIGLLVDSSMSQHRILQEEREASFDFFEQVLRPDEDRIFVISFDVDVELLQDLTSQLKPLQSSLRDIRVPSREDGRQFGTVLFDAVYLAADELMVEQSGRKAMILISDGVDFGSIVDSEVAIESSQRADTIIYSIRYYDENANGGKRSRRMRPGGMGRGPGRFPGGGGPGKGPGGGGRRRQPPDGKAILKELSTETGGTLFEVSEKLPLNEVFSRIEKELRSQYIIGYRPQKGTNGDFRKIALRTKNKKLKVQTRSGYYPIQP